MYRSRRHIRVIDVEVARGEQGVSASTRWRHVIDMLGPRPLLLARALVLDA